MLHSMTIRLTHIDQLEIVYLYYGVTCKAGVIWGHWDQKVIFTKNSITCPCYILWPSDSYMLICLWPSTYVMGSYANLGSVEVTGVKSSLLPKMLFLLQNKYYYLLYVTKCIHVCLYIYISLRASFALWVNFESFLPAGYADCVGNRF